MFLNAHFDIGIDNGNMFFDYKLKPGVCQTFNASMLLREIGLELDEPFDDGKTV